MSTITDSLVKAGFEPSVAEIYTVLVESGELSVGQIVEKSKLSRAGAYDALNLLLAQGYLEYRKEGRNAFYKAVHPEKLFGLIEEKKHETAQLEDEVKGAIRALTGAFNLSQNKPGVRFLEGEDGVKEVWWDSLNSKEIVRTYGDLEFLAKHFEKLNSEYLAERIKREIKKRAITNDSEYNRSFLKQYDSSLTETRLMNTSPMDFSSVVMQIYDNKISYTTLSGDIKIAVILEDKKIYQMQKNLFDFNWQLLGVARLALSVQPNAQT